MYISTHINISQHISTYYIIHSNIPTGPVFKPKSIIGLFSTPLCNVIDHVLPLQLNVLSPPLPEAKVTRVIGQLLPVGTQ